MQVYLLTMAGAPAERRVVFDVDVAGGINLKNKFRNNAFSVFVKPPGLKVLEERLRKRATDDPESLAERIQKAGKEMEYAEQFDYILTNDILEDSLKEAEEVVASFINN